MCSSWIVRQTYTYHTIGLPAAKTNLDQNPKTEMQLQAPAKNENKPHCLSKLAQRITADCCSGSGGRKKETSKKTAKDTKVDGKMNIEKIPPPKQRK
jgi:hypothetical protein